MIALIAKRFPASTKKRVVKRPETMIYPRAGMRMPPSPLPQGQEWCPGIAWRATMRTLPLIEPVPIDDDLVTGLALIEDVELGARFVFYATQTAYESDETVFVVKRKIVLPLNTLAPFARTTLGYVARRRIGGGGILRPVK
jgi:hypothetical protein